MSSNENYHIPQFSAQLIAVDIPNFLRNFLLFNRIDFRKIAVIDIILEAPHENCDPEFCKFSTYFRLSMIEKDLEEKFDQKF